VENRKKFKNEKPEKKDHAVLKTTGKILKGVAGTAAGAFILVLNKDRIKAGLNLAKGLIKK